MVEQPEIAQTLNGCMNYSCDSNVWMDDEATLVARWDIAAGEEIADDYGLITTQPNWILDNTCHCGSPHCRQKLPAMIGS